jgi:hypothetical protein
MGRVADLGVRGAWTRVRGGIGVEFIELIVDRVYELWQELGVIAT